MTSEPSRVRIAREGWLPVVLLLVTLFTGSFMRMVDLGGPDFHNDEVYHVMAAQSLTEGQGPTLPSGWEYRRGIDVTRMVGFLIERIQPPELAARLPAAGFGILALFMFAAVAWAIAGPWAAFWASLFMAIYPEAIVQSRQVRFYTYQLCFGILAMFTGWRAIRPADVDASELPDSETVRRWGWAMGTVLLLLLAARVQPVTLSVALGWFLVVALVAARSLFVGGWQRIKTDWRVQFLLICGIAGVVALPFTASRLATWFDLVRYVPVWAGSTPGDPRYYYWALTSDFPVLFSLLPAFYLYIWTRSRRLALFLACWFAVPFVLHSFLFAWKGERYIFLATPAFFLAAGISSAAFWKFLRQALIDTWPLVEWSVTRASRVSGLLVAVAAVGLLVTTPAFNEARDAPLFPKRMNWTAAEDSLARIPGSSSLPLGAGLPENALYYFGRVDFGVSRTRLEDPSSLERGDLREDGVPDLYTGVPTLTRPPSVNRRFSDDSAAIIIFDREHHHLSSEMLRHLRRNGTEHCRGGCGELSLYYLPLR